MATAKKNTNKLSDAEQVEAYMKQTDHPLKAETEAVRKIIKANKALSERIKWNAPSYYSSTDIVTFALHNKKLVQLVFHHPAVVKIKSTLLQGNYKDRRLVLFESMQQVKENEKELKRIIGELLVLANK